MSDISFRLQSPLHLLNITNMGNCGLVIQSGSKRDKGCKSNIIIVIVTKMDSSNFISTNFVFVISLVGSRWSFVQSNFYIWFCIPTMNPAGGVSDDQVVQLE